MGSEGGPCTGGGACDPGLVCLSNLCVNPNAGEGEGEGCQGDEASPVGTDDCNGIPAAACGPLDENAILTTCRDASLILRTGIFAAAFECINAIPAEQCASPDDDLADCFAPLRACPFQAASNLCNQANDTCVAEGQNDFPRDTCVDDMTSTNLAFHTAYADCFNNAAKQPCASVHDFCYSFALATLIKAQG